jgi:actin-related protein 6
MADGEVGPSLNAYNDVGSLTGDAPPKADNKALPVECVLVIDSGYSHTTVTPVYRGRAIQQAVRRLDIGGKFMTNYLKEILSIRQMDVREETYLVNQMKEEVCFVSKNFKADLERTWKGGVGDKRSFDGGGITVDFVLPDYSTRMRGEVRPHEPAAMAMRSKAGAVAGLGGVKEYVTTLGNERFTTPELLFNPGDIGLKQAGLPEMVMQTMSCLPPGLWTAMLSNILLTGGNAHIQGFDERLYVHDPQR